MSKTIKVKKQDHSMKFAFVLITSLFFMWGLSYGLLDVLNKHFQETLGVSKGQSGLLQAAYFGAYFVIALPAAIFMEKYGYKRGILVGLSLFAAGALLFVPASQVASFSFFLFALFVIALGLGCLETAANPYVTVLGDEKTATRRLNLSQSFNGLGSFIGPIIGGAFFFQTTTDETLVNPSATGGIDSVQLTYVAIAIIVIILAVFIARTRLPDIREAEEDSPHTNGRSLLSYRHYVNGVVTLFFYIAAQVGIGAFFINYAVDHWGDMSSSKAAYWLSIGMLLYMVGRFIGTALMQFITERLLLGIFAFINILLTIVVIKGIPVWSVIALILVFLFMSIMFPTIFGLSLEQLGPKTKRGSSFLIMSLVGAAIAPSVMGFIADKTNIETAFWLPLFCFIVVLWFAAKGSQLRT